MDCLLNDLDSSARDEMPLNPSDRTWIQKEISDQIGSANKDSAASLRTLEKDVAGIIGRLSVPQKAPHPYLVPVIGFAGLLVAAFWTWVGITLVQDGKSLSSIKQSLLGLGVTIAASAPSEADSQARARAALEEARSTSTTIPAPAVEQAGKSFIDTSARAPGAWDTALQFVNYTSKIRSVGFSPSPKNLLEAPLDSKLRATIGQRGRVSEKDPSLVEWFSGGIKPVKNTTGTIILDGEGNGSFILDEVHVRHVTFYRSGIIYDGGRVLVEDAGFLDCEFIIRNTPEGRALAKAILVDRSVTFDSQNVVRELPLRNN